MEPHEERYEILEKLGEGGYATVHLAFDPQERVLVAVKRLRSCSAKDPVNVLYFLHEQQILSVLDVRGVPRVSGMGESGGLPYFAMEFVDGATLEAHIRNHGLDRIDAAWLLFCVALLVHEIHEAGVVHGDLKPDNVLVDTAGNPWLVDFGAASVLSEAPRPEEDDLIVGTLAYISPEIVREGVRGRSVRSDVYALGVMLYDILAGRLPFDGDSQTQILEEIETRDAPPLHEVVPGISRALSLVVMRALARRPADRYPSARHFARALGTALKREGVRAARSAAEPIAAA
ncbi:MAG: serine/threonine protein kinase [Planctomycetes bacterium]|nr:serine/threonine protein kinase [Planctomycetota bacterium]